jgi:hypothetical protein
MMAMATTVAQSATATMRRQKENKDSEHQGVPAFSFYFIIFR